MSSLANMAAAMTVALGVYGSVSAQHINPALISITFTATFYFALWRAQSAGQIRMQLAFALLLICISFAVHLIFLPAGIGCFFTLMLCKNELLLPQKQVQKKID